MDGWVVGRVGGLAGGLDGGWAGGWNGGRLETSFRKFSGRFASYNMILHCKFSARLDGNEESGPRSFSVWRN